MLFSIRNKNHFHNVAIETHLLCNFVDEDSYEEKKEKPFRLYSKQLFLTYSQTNLEKKDVLEQLYVIFFKKLGEPFKTAIKEYIVARETHADGNSHIHVYLNSIYRLNFSSPRELDLYEKVGNKMIHGNYQSVKNRKKLIEYLTKEEDYFIYPLELKFEKKENRTTLLKMLHKTTEAESLELGMKSLE
jgi:hypothetical protein